MNSSIIADSNKPKTKRLFFALWPEEGLQQQLYGLAGQILEAHAGRRVVVKNIHLTLAFLGSVTESDQTRYEAAASGVSGSAIPLTLDQVGCFRRAGVLWVGPSRIPEELLVLVRDLNQALRSCGFTPESREYRAHLTLARNIRRCPDRDIRLPPISWTVGKFVLAQSHTESHGATYEILHRWELV